MTGFTEREARYLSRHQSVTERMNRQAALHHMVRLAALIALLGLLAILAYRALEPRFAWLDYRPAPKVLANGKEADLGILCAQYRSDHLMTGEPMSEAMRETCDY